MPTLDETGKVHGELPDPKDFEKYDKDELQKLADELQKSVAERIRKTEELGSDKGHGERQGDEQNLQKYLNKYLNRK